MTAKEWETIQTLVLLPANQKPRCKRPECGKVLSAYNTGGECFSHREPTNGTAPADDLDQQLDAALAAQRAEQVATHEERYQQILRAVSQAFEISIQGVLGHSRIRTILWSRQVAMYLLARELGWSKDEIADRFGRADAAGTVHACEQVELRMAKNDPFREKVEQIRDQIAVTASRS